MLQYLAPTSGVTAMSEQFVTLCPQCNAETAHKVCFLAEHRDCVVCLWCRVHHPVVRAIRAPPALRTTTSATGTASDPTGTAVTSLGLTAVLSLTDSSVVFRPKQPPALWGGIKVL